LALDPLGPTHRLGEGPPQPQLVDLGLPNMIHDQSLADASGRQKFGAEQRDRIGGAAVYQLRRSAIIFRMAFPVSPACPLSTDTFENGRVPRTALEDVTHRETSACLLAPEMAKCWIALREAVAKQFEVQLVILGGGAYRDFDAQVSLFGQRYRTPAMSGLPSNQYRRWNGIQYSLRDGMASAATPGTSNHGRGAAVDAAILGADGKVVAITSRTDMFDWLLQHAHEFGLSWELQSEPWHLRAVGTVASPLVVVTDPVVKDPIVTAPVVVGPVVAHPVVADPVSKPYEEDAVVIFKTKQTGDKLFALDATKRVRHISGFEGAVAEAAEPGWATKVTLLVVPNDVAAWLDTL
jgi:D-alanyl-D-alanine dipeptidase